MDLIMPRPKLSPHNAQIMILTKLMVFFSWIFAIDTNNQKMAKKLLLRKPRQIKTMD